MLTKILKNLIKVTINAFGYKVKIERISKRTNGCDTKLLNDPRQAFIEPNHKKICAFHADLSIVRDHQCFSLGSDGWHPFVQAIKNSEESGNGIRDELFNFYSKFQPANAQEAIIGFKNSPEKFLEFPPYMFYITPWTYVTPEMVKMSVERWVLNENKEHGERISLGDGGFQSFGPVSKQKLNLEAKRLASITKSLKTNGYDLRKGNCNFRVIKLGSEIRLISDGGGYHRAASAAALDFEFVPGGFHPGQFIIDVDYIAFWPNVSNGLWSRKQALSYVEHIFYFDSSAWAKKHGFIT